MMFYWCTLVLLTLVPVVTGVNAGVKVKLTQNGLDYVVGKATEMLKHMDIPDQISGTEVTGVQIRVDKFNSVQKFVPKVGVTLTIDSANIHVTGNQASGESSSPFKVNVDTLAISVTVAVQVDGTGHLTLNIEDCKAKVAGFGLNDRQLVKVISWFNKFLPGASTLICSKVKSIIAVFNTQLATLNAKALEHGIDFSLGPTVVSSDSIELSLKDIFIHMGQPKETHLPPTDFTLPSQNTKMFYIGISAFTINSIIAEIHKSGLLIYRITEDMVSSLILSTKTFGAYIPEISKKYPDQKMMLEIQTVKEPVIKFETKDLILEVLSTMTAYVIQSDNKLFPLFVLNLMSSVSAQVYGTELNLAVKLTLNKMEASIKETNINPFEVTKLNSFLDNIKYPVFTWINAYLPKVYPGFILPLSLGEIHLVNTQVECITCANAQGYLLIGSDVQIQENASPQHS